MVILPGIGKIILLVICLCISLAVTASAACPETKLEVLSSAVTIDNPGALTPGMGVLIAVRVDFPENENTTYPETNQLELTSGLDEPVWTWYIVRNGVKKDETEERKPRVVLSGNVLSWPANTTESLEIALYGTAPSVMETKNLTVLRILDFTSSTCIGDSVYQYNAYVLNTTVTRERIRRLDAELFRLRSDAAALNQTRGGTSAVMEKIGEAQQSLDAANATPVFEFVSVGLALDRADAAIADGRRLLDVVPVYGTTLPQQGGAAVREELPGTPQQTPASAEPAPVLLGIVACAGAVILLMRGRS